MKLWDQFYPDVVPDVLGVPEPTMDRALLRAAQRFLEQTEVWRQWLDDTTTNGDFEHDIELESKSEVVAIKQAVLAGREIRVYAPDDLPATWRTSGEGVEVGVCTFNGKTVQLVPLQSAGQVLSIEATLKPSNAATGVPDDVFDRYSLQIAQGAKALLLAQPGKTWSDLKLAAVFAGLFDSDINRIAAAHIHGLSSAPRRVRASFL